MELDGYSLQFLPNSHLHKQIGEESATNLRQGTQVGSPSRWDTPYSDVELKHTLSMKSLTSGESMSGIMGSALMIRLEMSCCVFLSPSIVNGLAPVSSSYVSTPRLHQSTAWWRWQKEARLLNVNRRLCQEAKKTDAKIEL